MKVKVESYTLRGKEKIIHEPVISDEYWTEHKNFDGSILKVKVTPVTELNERNSVDEGEKSSYRIKKCESCGCEFEANIAKLCYRCWSEQEIQNDEILKNKE